MASDKLHQPSIDAVRARLLAKPGEPFRLSDRDSGDRELFEDKKHAEISLKKDAAVINELQDMLYANGDRALLVVLQGMDTAGKSGVIRSVFADCSPLGMQVEAFKAPSKTELAHDYLWRIHEAVPRKGRIGIFDRSHYEDVLVVRVRDLAPRNKVEQRYEQINNFEKHLSENGVHILKIMLHISYETQGERLMERLENPNKRWKFNPGDLDDRALWKDYEKAYELALERCSTEHAPWHVVPSDSRSRRKAIAARLVRGALEDIDPQIPDPGYRPDQFKID